jgi:circadian clock protein KaiC
VDAHHYRRIFLDGLEPFARESMDPERAPRFIAALLNSLRDREVTVLLTQHPDELFGPELHSSLRGVEALCDNILFLRLFEVEECLHRRISVLKMRDSDNDPRLRELAISSRGVEVREPGTSPPPRGPPRPPARKKVSRGSRGRKQR